LRQTDRPKKKKGGFQDSTCTRPTTVRHNGHHRRPEGHPRPPARERLHRIVECGSLLPTSTVRYECGTTSDRLPQVDMLPPVSNTMANFLPLLVLGYILLYITVHQHRLTIISPPSPPPSPPPSSSTVPDIFPFFFPPPPNERRAYHRSIGRRGQKKGRASAAPAR